MKRILTALIFALFLAAAAPAQLSPAEVEYVNSTLWPATALLYSQTPEGSMNMRCTATAIAEDATSYTFVTAAHCGCTDDATKNITTPEKAFFFVAPDSPGNKIYLRAMPKGCGYQRKGDDFFLLTADKTVKFPVIPLGKDPKVMDAFVNIGGPIGLGKQVFLGQVSSESLNRPIIDGDIQWTGAVLIQEFGVNGGSSGSAVICLKQHAICAFVVGSIRDTTMVAMPVSRLIKVQAELAAGTYRWYHPDPDAPLVGQSPVPPAVNGPPKK